MVTDRQWDTSVDSVDHAIAQATRQILDEAGYARLTVDEVARRAGVGEAAIHRRFAGRAEMVFAVTMNDLDFPPPPDCGSLHADLVALVGQLIDTLGAPACRQAVPGLLGETLADSGLAERFRAALTSTQRAGVMEVLDRAVIRGELATRPDPQLVHTLLLGPVFAALFLVKVDPADLPARVATVVGGALAQSTPDDVVSRRVVTGNVVRAW